MAAWLIPGNEMQSLLEVPSVRTKNFKNGVLAGHGMQLCNNYRGKTQTNSLPSENFHVYTHDFCINAIPECLTRMKIEMRNFGNEEYFFSLSCVRHPKIEQKGLKCLTFLGIKPILFGNDGKISPGTV